MYLYEIARLLHAISTIYIAHASLPCSRCFKIFLGRIFFGMGFSISILRNNYAKKIEALSQY